MNRYYVGVLLLSIAMLMNTDVVESMSGCWLSHHPGGDPATHVPGSIGSADGTYWLNVSDAPAGKVKFIVKLPAGAVEKKSIQDITNHSGGSFSMPYAFSGFNSTRGTALLVVKDGVSSCKYPFTIGGSAYESLETRHTENGTVNSRVFVLTPNFPIQKVMVSVAIDHPVTGELRLRLISPTGKSVILSQSRGVGANFGTNSFVRTVFDDDAQVSVVNGPSPFQGVYVPEQSLSTFNGDNPNGFWTLEVIDQLVGNDGYIKGWSLTIAQ